MKLCNQCDAGFTADTWTCPKCESSPSVSGGFPQFAPELSHTFDQGFPSEGFDNLFSRESGNFWFRNRNRLIVWALRTYFPRIASFLEIGCGTGYVLTGIQSELPHLSLYGSEIYEQGLVCAASRLPNTPLFQMDARAIPFENEFDVIGAFDVLEHIKEDELVLNQMVKALSKPHGGIILTVPQHKALWSVTDDYSCHFRRYEALELKTKLERAGLKIARLTSFTSLLLPLMFASRRLNKSIEEFDPTRELSLNPFLNATLETVLRFEHGLIASGLSLPAGGSLLAIAMLKSD
jgi:SAM-dependent methyltransferase